MLFPSNGWTGGRLPSYYCVAASGLLNRSFDTFVHSSMLLVKYFWGLVDRLWIPLQYLVYFTAIVNINTHSGKGAKYPSRMIKHPSRSPWLKQIRF